MSKKLSRRDRMKESNKKSAKTVPELISGNSTFCADVVKHLPLPDEPVDNKIRCVDSISSFFYLNAANQPDRNKPIPAKTYIIPARGERTKKYAINFIDVGYWWYRKWNDIDLRWHYYREHGVLILPAKEAILTPKVERIAAGQSIEDFALNLQGKKPMDRSTLSKKIQGQLTRKTYKMAFDQEGNLEAAEPGSEKDYTEIVVARRFIFPMWHIHVPSCEKGRNKDTILIRFNPNYERLMRFYVNRYDQSKYETMVTPAYGGVMHGLLGDKIRDYEIKISEAGEKYRKQKNGGKFAVNARQEQTTSMMLINRKYMVWMTEIDSHPHGKNKNLQFCWRQDKRMAYGSTLYVANMATDLEPEDYIRKFILDENQSDYEFVV